jgi:hypothetical protein
MSSSSGRDEAKILYKLMRMGKWEHAHTSIDNLIKGFPKHKRGDVRKLIPKLIKRGLIHVKPTAYGREVSLNIERKKEIEEFIARYFEQI